MVRALAPGSHKCVVRAQILALTPLRVVLLLVLPFAPRGFSLGTPIFRSPKKPAFPNSNSNVNGGGRTSIYVDVSTSKSLFTTSKLLIIIYSFIYLSIYLQFLYQLPANATGTDVVHALMSMMNFHPTGNVAHSTRTTVHLQLTTVVASRSRGPSLFHSCQF